MATIFSRIIAGEIPCYKVAENEKFFAFLDINPLVKGHTLVVPKQEVDYIFDLSDEDLAAMHVFAKQVACAIKKAFPCQKVGEAVDVYKRQAESTIYLGACFSDYELNELLEKNFAHIKRIKEEYKTNL